MPPLIRFQKEENLKFSLRDKNHIVGWIQKIVRKEGKQCGDLLYFFCTDKHLLKINKEFLDHDTYTDIITFDYSAGKKISGEIYISVERVKENAAIYEQAFNDELKRTIIHGILHLCGYSDKTELQKKEMRRKETYALGLY